MNVKSADGTPCPTPPKRERRKKDKDNGDDNDGEEKKTDNGKSDDDAEETPEGGSKKKKNRRKRGGGGKKKDSAPSASGDESDAKKSKDKKKKKDEVEKQPTWEDSLDEKVRTSMKERGITVDSQGRAFLTVGESARIKLGTDSYAALAHSDGLLAEGEWSVEPTDGKVTIKWTKVLKWGKGSDSNETTEGGVWTVSSADDEASLLVSDFCLTDGKF